MVDKLSGRVYTDSSPGPFFRGSGALNDVIVAPFIAIYARSDGGANTSIYCKESGNGTNTGVTK